MELALKAKEIENGKKKQAQMFQSQEAMIANMSKQQDADSFYAATAATITSYDGVIRKISQKVM